MGQDSKGGRKEGIVGGRVRVEVKRLRKGGGESEEEDREVR